MARKTYLPKSTPKSTGKRAQVESSSDNSDADLAHYEYSMAIVKALHHKEKKGKKTTVSDDTNDIEALREENEALVAALEVAQAELKNRVVSFQTGSSADRRSLSRALIPVHKKSEYSMQRFREDVGCAGDENKRCWLGMRAKARNAILQAKMDFKSTWLGHSKTDIVLAINLLTDKIPELQRFDRNWGAESILNTPKNSLKEAFEERRARCRTGKVPEASSKRKRPNNKDTSSTGTADEEANQTAKKRSRPSNKSKGKKSSSDEDESESEAAGKDGKGDDEESNEDRGRDVPAAKAKPTPKTKSKSQLPHRSEAEQSSNPSAASRSQARDKPVSPSPSKSSRKKTGKSNVERCRSDSPARSNNATGREEEEDHVSGADAAADNDGTVPGECASLSKKRKKQQDESPQEELPTTLPSKKKKTTKAGKRGGRKSIGAEDELDGSGKGGANTGKEGRMETRSSKKANTEDDAGQGGTPAQPAKKNARQSNGKLNQGSQPDSHSPQPKPGNVASEFDLGDGGEDDGRGIRPLDRRALSSSEPETDSSEIE
ncbi:hypothetical protein RhiJN_24831 [Ceratobasidium sp. AG-Ba]|nr:hypothetical protein RhiJN_24831 [Ceratobasidium sp. AG-Ba]